MSPEELDRFLKRFNDDTDAAIAAIRQHARAKRSFSASPRISASRPVGKTLVSVRSLGKKYKVGRHTVQALTNVTCEVHEGEFLVITAPSGSGKSTLLQLMGGLDKPTNGSVTVDGVDLSSLSDSRLSEFRSHTIGFVFQFFYLQPFLSLERNLELPGIFAHTKRQERQARAKELAATVGIGDKLGYLPKELSGGQIQRAAIIRALLNSPKIILADEPTGNLDRANSVGIIDLFEQIRQTLGTAIVIATHDTAIAERADRVISLQDGAIV
jgi:ABC-type lipoprotein export system ATPase subunit